MLEIDAATNQACAVIHPTNELNPDFLFYHLKNDYEELRKLGRGGNQPNLNVGMIKNYKIIVPPLDLQDKYSQIVKNIESQKALIKNSIQESEDLFNALVQKAFRGKL